MAKMSKTAVLNEIKGKFEIKEYPVPTPKADEFILKVEYATVCGTDAHMWAGHLDFTPFPIVLGHEFCGRIEELGGNIKTDVNGNPVQVGDRVVIAPGVACGECYFCRIAKTPTRCVNCPTYGFMKNDDFPLTGGFSQYVHVRFPGTAFFKTDLAADIACATEPMSIAVHAFQRAHVPLGGTVVVQGIGAVGLGAIAMAKIGGASKVVAIGGPKARGEVAKKMGADVVIDIDDVKDSEERIKLVKSMTHGNMGADMVVEAAGFPSTVPEGIAMTRDSGTFIEMGHFTDMGSVSINPHFHIVRNNMTIHGIWGSSVDHLKVALDIMEANPDIFCHAVSHRIPLRQLDEAVTGLIEKRYALGDGEEVVKIAIDPWLD